MSSVADEVRAARAACGWIDRSARGKLIARGADRQAFLHNMLSNRIAPLKAGQGCRAELLDERAHVIADLRLYVDADAVLIDTEPGLASVVRERLEKYVIMDDVAFEDATASLALVTLVGPKAATALWRNTGGVVPPPAPFDHRFMPVAGVDARVVCARWTGPGDVDVFLPAAAAASVRDALARSVAGEGGAALSADAFEVMRIEGGIARQGAELDDVVALEARLDEAGALALDKCYLGQEVIARIVGRGHVNRLLAGIILSGDRPAVRGATIIAGEKEVGHVVASVFSPTLGKPIATVYLRREAAAPGTSVDVEGTAATVAALPFVAPI